MIVKPDSTRSVLVLVRIESADVASRRIVTCLKYVPSPRAVPLAAGKDVLVWEGYCISCDISHSHRRVECCGSSMNCFCEMENLQSVR